MAGFSEASFLSHLQASQAYRANGVLNQVCSKQTKQIASQVAIATCMQPVKLCRIIVYKSRSVFLKQLMLHHSLLKRTPP